MGPRSPVRPHGNRILATVACSCRSSGAEIHAPHAPTLPFPRTFPASSLRSEAAEPLFSTKRSTCNRPEFDHRSFHVRGHGSYGTSDVFAWKVPFTWKAREAVKERPGMPSKSCWHVAQQPRSDRVALPSEPVLRADVQPRHGGRRCKMVPNMGLVHRRLSVQVNAEATLRRK